MNTLSLMVACLGFVFAILITFFLFNYARAAQKKSEQLWKCAENLIVSTAETLVNQQGKPVDAKFAENISVAVNKYYDESLKQGSDSLNNITQARFLARVALLCKSQGLLGEALANYERSFAIFSRLAPKPKKVFEPWIGAYNSLSGEADVQVQQGRFKEAQQKYEESLKRRHDVVDSINADSLTDYAQGLVNLGDVSRELGDWDRALTYIDEGIQKQNEALNLIGKSRDASDDRNHHIDEAKRRLGIFQRTRTDLLKKLGKFDEAKTQIENVITILGELSARSPNVIDSDLARAYTLYGDIRVATGDLLGATKAYETARLDWEGVSRLTEYNLSTQVSLIDAFLKEGDVCVAQAAPPSDVKNLLESANTRYGEAQKTLNSFYGDTRSFFFQNLSVKVQMKFAKLRLVRFQFDRFSGQTDLDQDSIRSALIDLVRSETVYQSWLHDSNDSFRAKANLADLLCEEGDMCLELSMLQEAIQAYRRSLSLQKELLQLTPDNLDRQLDVAVDEDDLAQALLRTDDQYAPAEALLLCDDSARIYRAANRILGGSPRFVNRAAESSYCLGLVKIKLGARKEALQQFRAASDQLHSAFKNTRVDRDAWILEKELDVELLADSKP